MEKPKILYCFKLDENSATIKRYEIENYVRKVFTGKPHLVYNHHLDAKYATTHSVAEENLDKVVHMKIHTFNPDLEEALAIMNAYLILKRENSYKDYQRFNELIIHLNKNI